MAEARRKYPDELPGGFDIANVTTARVCNVVIASYNAQGNPSLDARVSRAIALLRGKC